MVCKWQIAFGHVIAQVGWTVSDKIDLAALIATEQDRPFSLQGRDETDVAGSNQCDGTEDRFLDLTEIGGTAANERAR